MGQVFGLIGTKGACQRELAGLRRVLLNLELLNVHESQCLDYNLLGCSIITTGISVGETN